MTGEERAIRGAALWSAILNIGGVLLLAGSLGYAVLTLQAYEDRYGPVDGGGPIQPLAPEEAAPVEMAPVAGSGPAESSARPPETQAQDAASNPQIAELTENLQDARGRLAEAEARNETLQRRVEELEQQATAQGASAAAAAAEVAQCRADITGLRSRHDQLVDRMRRGTQALRDSLQVCLARPDPPPPPVG